MALTKINGSSQIQAGTITRSLLNIASTGNAVIAKAVAGSNISLTQTGIDAGTGDVTVNVSPTPSFTSVTALLASLNPSINSGTNISTAQLVGTGNTSIGATATSYIYPSEVQYSAGADDNRLQVAGYRRIAGAAYQGSAFRIQYAVNSLFTDGSKAYIEIGAADSVTSGGGTIALGTAGADVLYINNAGNVGIGNIAPSSKLSVTGSFNATTSGAFGTSLTVGTTLGVSGAASLSGGATTTTVAAADNSTNIATTAFTYANVVRGDMVQAFNGAYQLKARQNIAAAGSGANSDITSITGLTTALTIGQGGTGSTTALAAATALGIYNRTAVSNANYTILTTDRTIAYATLAAARIVTLPACSSFPAGVELVIEDESGACSAVNTITINTASAADFIGDAATLSYVLQSPFDTISLINNGVHQWIIVATGLKNNRTIAAASNDKTLETTGFSALRSIRNDLVQSFTTAEKLQARQNAGAAASGANTDITQLATPIGIGTAATTFAVQFAAALGDKIGLYSGATYGFGIQSNQIQMYTSAITGKLSLGYGNSAAFTSMLDLQGTVGAIFPLGFKVGIGLTPSTRAALTVNGTVSSATAGPHIETFVSGDAVYPVIQHLNYNHDNISIGFDSYYDGAGWKSSFNAVNFQIYKASSVLNFNWAAAGAAGTALTWNTAFSISSSGVTFGGVVTLGANANATAPVSGDNTTKVATTAFLNSYALRGDLNQSLSATIQAQLLKNLGIFQRKPVSDANYTILNTDDNVVVIALTAARVLTLPQASTFPVGTPLLIIDESGSCSTTNTLTINPFAGDTIDGLSSHVLNFPYASVVLKTNGGGTKWVITATNFGTSITPPSGEIGSRFITGSFLNSYAIRADTVQTLSSPQKVQAQSNIGLVTVSSGSAGDSSSNIAATSFLTAYVARNDITQSFTSTQLNQLYNNIKQGTRTTVADSAYTVVVTDRVVAFTSLTASRIVTLPLASAFPVGTSLVIKDESGNCNTTRTIVVNATGSDKINLPVSFVINVGMGFVALRSNGTNWFIEGSSTYANVLSFVTRTAAAAAYIPADANTYIQTQNYATVGDNGGALYHAVPSTTLTGGLTFTTANGVIFEIATKQFDIKCTGALGNASADDYAAFNSIPQADVNYIITVSPGTYLLSADITTLATFVTGPGVNITGVGILYGKVERPHDIYAGHRPTLGDVIFKWVAGTQIKIGCFGDSITYGADTGGSLPSITDPGGTGRTDGGPRANPPWPSALQNSLTSISGTAAVVYNYGYPGNTTKQLLHNFPSLSSGNVDLEIYMIGTNDSNPVSGITVSDYKRNLGLLIHRAFLRGAAVIFVGPPNPPNPASVGPIRPFITAMRSVAMEFGIDFIDSEEQIKWQLNRWSPDGFHPNSLGYTEIGWHLAALITSTNGFGVQHVAAGQIYQAPDRIIIGGTEVATGFTRSGFVQEIAASSAAFMPVFADEDVIPIFTLTNNSSSASSLLISYAGGTSSVPIVTAYHQGTSSGSIRRRTFGPVLHRGLRNILLTNAGSTVVDIECVEFVKADQVEPFFSSGLWCKSSVSGSFAPFDDANEAAFAIDYGTQIYPTTRIQTSCTLQYLALGTGILLAKAGQQQNVAIPPDCLVIGREGTAGIIDQYVGGTKTRLLGIVSLFPSVDWTGIIEARITSSTIQMYVGGVAAAAAVAYSTGIGTGLNPGMISIPDAYARRGYTCYALLTSVIRS